MSTNVLRFTYDRDVTQQTGTIKIFDDTNTLVKTVNSNDEFVNYSPRKVEADIDSLGITWEKNTDYVITVDAGFVQEDGNNKTNSPAQTINYATPGDPFVVSTEPNNNGVAVSLTIRLFFDEAVAPTSGSFFIRESGTSTTAATLSVNDPRISYEENVVSIDLSGLLKINVTYHIEADSELLKNGFDFKFQGIDNDSVLKFTTKDVELLHTITNPENFPRFGHLVDISEKFIAIATRRTSTSNGKIYIYNHSAELIEIIEPPVPLSTETSGHMLALSLSDNFLAVTVPFTGLLQQPDGLKDHTVYVFNVNTGELVNSFTSPDVNQQRNFGSELKILNNQIAILAAGQNESNTAAVSVFDIATGNLIANRTNIGFNFQVNKLSFLVNNNIIFRKTPAVNVQPPPPSNHIFGEIFDCNFDTNTGTALNTFASYIDPGSHEFGRYYTTTSDRIIISSINDSSGTIYDLKVYNKLNGVGPINVQQDVTIIGGFNFSSITNNLFAAGSNRIRTFPDFQEIKILDSFLSPIKQQVWAGNKILLSNDVNETCVLLLNPQI